MVRCAAGVRSVVVGLVVAVLAAVTVLVGGASPSGAGEAAPLSVSGTVSEEGSGVPLGGISVRLLPSTKNVPVAARITAVDGSYSFGNVPAGSYKLRFVDLDSSHVSEYHVDAPKFSSGSVVSVAASTVVDAQLRPRVKGMVAGRVTIDGSGVPIEGVAVRLLTTGNVMVGKATTKSDGTYSILGQSPGDYKVRFIDPSGAFLSEYHVDAATFAPAGVVTVAAAAITTVDAALTPADQRDIAVAVGTFHEGARILTREPGDPWVLESVPGLFTLHDVAFDGGTRWVAVGKHGSIATSQDAATWATQQLPGGPSLAGVAHDGNGRWVAVGTNTIVASPDGVTWTPSPDGVGIVHRGVAHDGAGLWVAVGDGGSIRTSTDGTAWTTRTSGTTANLSEVAHGDGTWVAVAASGAIVTSTDGVTWTPRSSGVTTSLIDVAHGDGSWIATMHARSTSPVANLVTSSDGFTWTPIPADIGHSNFGAGIAAQPIAWMDSGEWLHASSAYVDLFGTATFFGSISSSIDGASWSEQQEFGAFGLSGDATALYAFTSGKSTGRPE